MDGAATGNTVAARSLRATHSVHRRVRSASLTTFERHAPVSIAGFLPGGVERPLAVRSNAVPDARRTGAAFYLLQAPR
jgi:hypothetical protein